MAPDNLKTILNDHRKWLLGEGGKRANLGRADLGGADLREADLRWADLRGADLRWADLRGADLREADLREADLRGADLREADLREADLRGASLGRANLREADLWSTLGNGRQIKSLQCGTHDIAYTAEVMQIGCERHTVDDWWAFDDDRIANMDLDALNWWRIWKPILQQIIATSPAVKTGKENKDD